MAPQLTAPLADHDPAWLSWSAPILDASDPILRLLQNTLAVPTNRLRISARTKTITASQFWRSKEKEAFALTIAKPAAVISRPTPEKEVRTCCWLTGPQFISTLSPAIAD